MSEKSRAKGYRDLLVWQKGVALAKEIYRLTQLFPREEKFGLVSQMRRAGVSIPSNLAEGQVRQSTGEFVQFISNAEGSLAELDTQLTLGVELGYCAAKDATEALELLSELRKMLNALRRKLLARHG